MSSDLCRGRALGTCGGGRPPASSPLGARGPQVAPRRGLGSSGEGGGRRTQATGAGHTSHALPVTRAGAFAPPPKQSQVLAFSVGGSPGRVPGLPAEAPEGFPLEAPGSPSLGCSLGAGTLGSLCLSRLPRPELKPPRARAAGGVQWLVTAQRFRGVWTALSLALLGRGATYQGFPVWPAAALPLAWGRAPHRAQPAPGPANPAWGGLDHTPPCQHLRTS